MAVFPTVCALALICCCVNAQRSSFLDSSARGNSFSGGGSRDSSSFGSSSNTGNFPLTGGRGTSDFGFGGGGSSSSSSRDRAPSTSGSDSFGFGDTPDTDNDDLQTRRIQAWSNGIVPYEFTSDISSQNSDALKRMFATISDKTCVSFVPHRNEANYTLIKSGSGCSAPLGVSSRPQGSSSSSSSSNFGSSRLVGPSSNRNSQSTGASVVTLASGCFTTKRVARRILNLLGIPHETSRPDRDQFVEINTNNIRSGYMDNLKQYTASSYLPGVLDIPYDLQSVTQYSDDDLAKDPRTWAIRPKNSRFSARDLGGDNFSAADFDKINAAYGCRRGGGSSSGSRGGFGGSSLNSGSSNFGSSSGSSLSGNSNSGSRGSMFSGLFGHK